MGMPVCSQEPAIEPLSFASEFLDYFLMWNSLPLNSRTFPLLFISCSHNLNFDMNRLLLKNPLPLLELKYFDYHFFLPSFVTFLD